MPPVTIYTTRFCPYCTEAKEPVAPKKGIAFDEIDVSGDRIGAGRHDAERAGGRTSVPQIFIGETPRRGLRRPLTLLTSAGQLDPLLAA